jgi:V/A-type H+-transporting ATPase subunit A
LRTGIIERITGSVVVASGIKDVHVGEIADVGEEGLIGEVIRVSENNFTIQVYEPTSGVKPGEGVVATGKRLIAELGPGLLTNILDGIGRPLQPILQQKGPFLSRGIKLNTLPRDKKWHFKHAKMNRDKVEEGDIIGEVEETTRVSHKIMVPPGVGGKVVEIRDGDFTIEEPVAILDQSGKKTEIRMMQEWPIRLPRPSRSRLPLERPLITGQRVIDTFFPLPKGGTACIPGGFGTGKTVVLQQLAKWSDAQVTVYIGCGERGNEICEVVTDFPELIDPRTGKPLMERTIIIANTSNMPVAAREASIYMGVTIAEYYRDMGYNVALMADSTSRWAEALREISSRLEEMPSEKGYPAYLPDRIAEFYERAGRVETLGQPQREGSVTLIGAVSPPSGDFNEPITIHTLRFTGVFWALDEELAYRRHFPAINWLKSYSLYTSQLEASWAHIFSERMSELEKSWTEKPLDIGTLRKNALELLSESSEIESIARIIGEGTLPDEQRLILLAAGLIEEGFLRQNAYGVDSFYSPPQQMLLLEIILSFYEKAKTLVKTGVPVKKIVDLPIISKMKRVKEDEQGEKGILQLKREADEELEKIAQDYGVT